MTETLRFAIVTDIHYGPDLRSKLGSQALELLEPFAAFVDDFEPDFVVDLGDRISDLDGERDRANMAAVAAVFERVERPRVHLLGNHDIDHLSPEDNEAIMGLSMASRSLDLGGWHLVFWQVPARVPFPAPARIERADIEWLERDLAATELPTILFSHVPLDSGSMLGNRYFQHKAHLATYPEVPGVRRTLLESGKVVLCIAGHTHWNRVSVLDGTPFVTIQSLTESCTTPGRPTGAFAGIEVGEEIRWRTYGGDPIQLVLPVKPLDHHWMPPRPAEPGWE